MNEDALPGNHSRRDVGPVAIMCMAPEARDLMDRSLKAYGEHVRETKCRQSVPGFMDWLFKSGLVDDVQEKAIPAFEVQRRRIREGLVGHPNEKYRRSMNRRSVYSFAYWFFRWSGLVDSSGKKVR